MENTDSNDVFVLTASFTPVLDLNQPDIQAQASADPGTTDGDDFILPSAQQVDSIDDGAFDPFSPEALAGCPYDVDVQHGTMMVNGVGFTIAGTWQETISLYGDTDGIEQAAAGITMAHNMMANHEFSIA